MKCDICGKDNLNQRIVDSQGIFCIDCFQKLRSCAGCVHNRCAYQECAHPQKWIAQSIFGNPIPNPVLVKEICTGESGGSKCLCCADDLKGCNKPYGICKNYEELELGL